MNPIFTILPVVTNDILISPRCTPRYFLLRCKFINLIIHQLMVEFYLLTLPRFPSRKKKHKSYFGENRTHDFRTTSRCAGYLLDRSCCCTVFFVPVRLNILWLSALYLIIRTNTRPFYKILLDHLICSSRLLRANINYYNSTEMFFVEVYSIFLKD